MDEGTGQPKAVGSSGRPSDPDLKEYKDKLVEIVNYLANEGPGAMGYAFTFNGRLRAIRWVLGEEDPEQVTASQGMTDLELIRRQHGEVLKAKTVRAKAGKAGDN